MKHTMDYLNEIAKKEKVFYEMTEEESAKYKQCLLSIFQDVEKVCKKYNLQLILSTGSVLGAVRHKGFIPWDDDLDAYLMRDDLKIFKSVFEKELGDKYEISSPCTDKEPKALYTQVLRKGTRLVCVDDLVRPESNFFRIDIYPIEKLPDNAFLRKLKCRLLDILRILVISVSIFQTNNKLFKRTMTTNLTNKVYYYVRRMIGALLSVFGRKRLYNLFDRFAASSKGTKYVTVPTSRGMASGEKLPSAVFFPPSKAIFEGMEVLVPHDTNAYLKNLYGNYMWIPPVEKRERHFYVDVDFGVYDNK